MEHLCITVMSCNCELPCKLLIGELYGSLYLIRDRHGRDRIW